MTADLTEEEIMGRAPPAERDAPGFRAVSACGYEEIEFATIGEWQAFMDRAIQRLAGDLVRLRAFLDRNEDALNDLGQQPRFAKAVAVIRSQFARAMGETL